MALHQGQKVWEASHELRILQVLLVILHEIFNCVHAALVAICQIPHIEIALQTKDWVIWLQV